MLFSTVTTSAPRALVEPPAGAAAPGRPSPARLRRRTLWLVAAVALTVAAALAWIGIRGWQARAELTGAMPQVEQLQAQLLSGDTAAAEQTLTQLRASTQRVRDLTSDPVWALAARTPWVGANLAAVSTVTAGLDDVADTVLPAVVASADALDLSALTPVDGRVELAPLAAAAPTLSRASGAMALIDARVGAIRTDDLVGLVRAPVSTVQDQLHHVALDLRSARAATALLPPMLGADGPRTYLVLLQTNAELRATGGMPGALSVVTADDGRLTLTAQSSAGAVNAAGRTEVELAPEDEALYSRRMALYLSDVNFTPHFPTAAQLAREMWRQYSGQQVDGVLATDPVALSYLLAATGPVPDGFGGQLASGNAVDMLLSGAYERFPDSAEQDAYFAAVGANVFQALLDGGAAPTATLPALARAAREHRLLVWSARAEERVELAGTVLSGEMPTAASGPTTVGVFFNDGTGSKMDYHLATGTEVVASRCDVVGSVHTVRVSLANEAPLNAAEVLGPSVTGAGSYGVAPGEIATSVVVIGPLGGRILSLERDGRLFGTGQHRQDGRPADVFSVRLAPGEQTVVEIEMSAPTGSADLELWSTPTKDQSGLDIGPRCT